ncbi:hypothetical protein DYB26_016328 [Aphanomyces astaci]|uniref:Uncharacterized protein n=1 Tax=Aphanomyces astaci TaxID=112090 RepID=A0A418CJV6_APHAT|nr:hypothetical protein DYB26_016328 [Aphanomyces astaci]
MAQASETATDKRPPHPRAPKAMADWCGFCLSSGSHSTYTCTKLSRFTRTWCVKTLCFRQDELPSHLSNYPQVEVVDAIKADQAATAVANAMAKAAGVVEEPGHPSSTPFAKVTYQAVHRATLPAAIQATPASTTALIAKINAAVARFVSRPPAIAVAQATGTATTAKTAAITATNQDDRRYRSRSHSMYADRRHRSRSAALPVR